MTSDELTTRANAEAPVPPWVRRQRCQELAAGKKSRAQLAREWGISRPTVTAFAKRHAAEIDAIRVALDDEFAGLWIAAKGARIAAYQADLEASASSGYGGHFEQVRTRAQILRQVAEELGQLPGRTGVVVVPVTHVLVDVNLDDLT